MNNPKPKQRIVPARGALKNSTFNLNELCHKNITSPYKECPKKTCQSFIGRETVPAGTNQIMNSQIDIERDIQSACIMPPSPENELDLMQQIRINENDIDHDIQCDICLEHEYEDDDQIVICELCNVAVH